MARKQDKTLLSYAYNFEFCSVHDCSSCVNNSMTETYCMLNYKVIQKSCHQELT